MISFFGFLFLCISIFLSILLIFWHLFKPRTLSLNLFNLLARLSTFFVLLSFGTLIYAYVVSDFSNFNVFQNSNSKKPMIYKITGAWGNHEGSMLMWVCIMSIYMFLFSFSGYQNEKFKKGVLFTQSILFLFFAFFIILTSNPFLVNSINVNEGLGLNPILQDPALAVHPPLLYLGYVGYSLVFSLAVVGIIQKNTNKDWIKILKNWSLFCWSMLTGGIALGSYWAYYELGWGGWWFWDPVENVSLMPWIAGLALVHSLMMSKGEQILIRWVVFLSILCFSLSIFGTFLVRSGILTSVHSFATDPTRGLFILLVFFLITGFGFLVFLLKAPENNNELKFLFINKTSAIIFNNLIMIIACLSILLGTIYPIIIEVLTESRVSVGGPYFNSTVLPIMLPGFFLMSIAPALSWQSNKIKKTKNYIVAFLTIALITFFISFSSNFNPWAFVGILLAIWIIISSIMSILILFKPRFNFNFIKDINAYIAHIGVGILILGITVSSIFQTEENIILGSGEEVAVSGFIITLKEIRLSNKSNYEELRGIFIIKEKNENIGTIEAGKNYYPVSKTITTEAGIFHDWFKDIYIILGDQYNEKWSLKIYNNPLVSLIWVGVFIMMLSGIIGVLKK